jgi:hypothetical protein
MKKLRLLLCFAGLLGSIASYGQNEKFKALFIYNFTNYIEWPEGFGSSFIITVIGDSPIVGELEAIAKIKKVGQASMEIKKVGAITDVGKTNILYIPAQKKKLLNDAATVLSGKPVLIISDNALGKFGINFVEVDQKQSFQVSKSNIEEHKLKVHTSLIALGVAAN